MAAGAAGAYFRVKGMLTVATIPDETKLLMAQHWTWDKNAAPALSRLIEEAKAGGYSQRRIAEAIGVSETALSQWKKGVHPPSMESLVALALAMNWSTDAILGLGAKGDLDQVIQLIKRAKKQAQALADALAAID